MLAGKKALITGASSGIGLEMTKQLAQAGIDVVIVSRNQSDLNSLGKLIADKYGVHVLALAQDLSRPHAAQDLYDKLQVEGWKPDILINNAGFGALGDFKDIDLKTQIEMMNVNMLALTELTALFLPHMLKQRWGRILNLASMAAFQPGPYMAVYFASKAYVYSFSSALHAELRGTGVSVTALCPGFTKTNFGPRAGFRTSFGVSAKQVAASGLSGMFHRRRVVVPGVGNKVVLLLEKLAPSGISVRALAFLQKRRLL